MLPPSAEVCCGLAVLTGALGAGSVLAGAALLAVLAAAVAAALLRGLDIYCHCLTMTGELISGRGVGRNLALMAAAVVVAWHGRGAAAGTWRGGAELLGATRLGGPAQLGILTALAVAVHLAALGARVARRREALAAIGRREPLGAGERAW